MRYNGKCVPLLPIDLLHEGDQAAHNGGVGRIRLAVRSLDVLDFVCVE